MRVPLRSGGAPSHNALGLACDVQDEGQVEDCIKRVESTLGPIDILVNSAGITENRLLIQSPADVLHNQLATNTVGVHNTCRAVLKSMLRRKNGSIVNIGSVVGLHGNQGQTAYSSSKSALVGFTKSLAKEVSPRGIRVNLICPGFIATDMTTDLDPRLYLPRVPLRRIGQPEEVAELVLYIANATYVTGAVRLSYATLYLPLS
ncbi:CBR4 [Cordylochernes scorpioides]|uniref:3-ketoacyl-[acyl-carrier-protein] reductase beta subunit n=1 Tax=Cordylochernes scorpioides TaxID=51811 RepID=A0ABY6L9K3_9ARAC|nr:CBR4 [Cordylochernes scorpioides]